MILLAYPAILCWLDGPRNSKMTVAVKISLVELCWACRSSTVKNMREECRNWCHNSKSFLSELRALSWINPPQPFRRGTFRIAHQCFAIASLKNEDVFIATKKSIPSCQTFYYFNRHLLASRALGGGMDTSLGGSDAGTWLRSNTQMCKSQWTDLIKGWIVGKQAGSSVLIASPQ